MKKINLFVIALIAFVLTGCGVDLKKTSTYTLNELSYEVPDVFESKPYDVTDNFGYKIDNEYYLFNDKKHHCSLSLQHYNYELDNLKNKLKVGLNIKDTSLFTQKNINNIIWEYGSNNNRYMYIVNYNKNGYIVTYEESNNYECDGVKDIIENSLKFN